MAEIFEAELTWTGYEFAPDVRIAVDDAGRITATGALAERVTRRLPGRALLPGFVNAHSHAFQRGLRGRGEHFPAGAGSFWSWREAMYELVAGLDREGVYRLSLQAFREMLACGITTVGEFHYLHHEDPDLHDHVFDEVVLAAARDAGIRLVLLQTYYKTGDVDRPLAGAQERFATPDLDDFWRRLEHLRGRLDPARQSLGVAAHSIRAVPLEDLAALARETGRRGLVLHMHVEEQRREIETTLAVYGATPMALVNRLVGDKPSAPITAVHCTHTAPADLSVFLDRGGSVCVCPTTEANLGDGIADLPAMLAGSVSLGTDSNARIAMAEEMRWLEYAQRLAGERRGVCRDGEGRVALELLELATAGGARALGLDAGAIRPGAWADLAAIDLDHPSLAGWDRDTLLESFVFGARDDALAEVYVGGRQMTGEPS